MHPYLPLSKSILTSYHSNLQLLVVFFNFVNNTGQSFKDVNDSLEYFSMTVSLLQIKCPQVVIALVNICALSLQLQS